MNSTLQGVLRFVTPPLGALLLELMNVRGVLPLDVFTAILAILPLFFIALPRTTGQALERGARAVMSEMGQGILYIWGHSGLRMLVATSVLVQFTAAPAFSFLPLYITGHFGGGATELGWFNSALGVGMAGGGIVMSVWGGLKRRIATSVAACSVIVLCALALGLAPAEALWYATAAYALLGICLAMHNSSNNAVQQAAVAPNMRGRFFATSRSLFRATGPLALAIAAPIAEVWGVRLFWFVAATGLALVVLLRRFTPSLYLIEDATNPELAAETARSDARRAIRRQA